MFYKYTASHRMVKHRSKTTLSFSKPHAGVIRTLNQNKNGYFETSYLYLALKQSDAVQAPETLAQAIEIK